MYRTIVKLLHEEEIAGVTVLRGIEGYGSTKQIHTAKIEFLSLNLPVVIVAVDHKEKIEAVFPKVKEMAGTEGLMSVERSRLSHRRPPSRGFAERQTGFREERSSRQLMNDEASGRVAQNDFVEEGALELLPDSVILDGKPLEELLVKHLHTT